MSQKNRFFLRRFSRMFIVILIPSLILSILAVSMASGNIRDEMESSSLHSVSSVEENISLVMGSAFQQNTYLTNMTRMSSALKRILFGDSLNYGDAIYIRSLQSLFTSMTNAYDYIDSALIYYDGGSRYISSDSSTQLLTEDSSSGWLEQYHNMPQDQHSSIALRTINPGTAAENQVLTVCQRLLMQEGCMVIDLNRQKLQNMLDAFLSIPDQAIYLLDTEGNILAESASGARFDLLSCIAREGGMESFTSGGSCRYTQEGFFSRSLICLSKRSDPSFYIVSVIPGRAFFSALGKELRLFGLVILLDLIIVACLSYSATRQSFGHIDTVLKMFEEAEQGNPIERRTAAAGDEYDMIMNNIVQLFLNTTYLNTQLKEKQYREENAELTALQLQINPHFLYNTLQTLDLEACRIEQGQDMHRIIRSLSEILKYALENPRCPVTLAEELDCLKKYMIVQNYRFGDHIIVYYDVEEELMDFPVFRMMLQPILENSLLHGLRPQNSSRGYVNIDIRREGDSILFAVSDTGIGMNAEQLSALRAAISDPESKSIGLTNLNRRLALYYGEQYTLQIESREGQGTCVSFRIPCRVDPPFSS